MDYLPNQPQYVRSWVHSIGVPQGTVLALFLFSLYTTDFSYNTSTCHLLKFSEYSAIDCLITDGDGREYRELTQDFVDWFLRSHFPLSMQRRPKRAGGFLSSDTIDTQGMDIEMMTSYKYLGVHLNINWTGQTTPLYFIRRVRADSTC